MTLLGSNYISAQKQQRSVFFIVCYVYAAVLCIAASVGLFILLGRQEPLYRAGVTFVVNNATEQTNLEYIADADLTVSQKLVDTYVTVIKSDTVLEQVKQAGGFFESTDQLRQKIAAEQVEDTEVFTVYVTDSDPEMAARIANTIAGVAPKACANIVTGSSAKVLDYAKEPKNPVSKQNIWKDAMLGALVAVALVVVLPGICFVIRLFIKRKTVERKNYERRSQ